MKFSILKLQATESDSFSNSIQSCFGQLTQLGHHLRPHQQIIKISLFTACRDNEDYQTRKLQMISAAACIPTVNAPISLISQPPLDKKTTMEIWMLDEVPAGTCFSFRPVDNGTCLRIENRQFSLLVCTFQCNQHAEYRQDVYETFRQLDRTLSKEGFTYGDILRQWNYIENITLTDSENDAHRQNYQVFNDYRTLFYQKSTFPNGYPAATGIGIENGGFIIDVMALKTKYANQVKPIGSSLQMNAHDYSGKVLVGKAIDEIKQLSTPKFERAKFIDSVIDGFYYISGTASIIGEKNVFEADIEKQTITTLQNISHLLSYNNLHQYHIEAVSPPSLTSYRVYIKNEEDYPVVKTICDEYFGKDVGVYVKAGICRNNLLVEIEATYLA